MAFPRQEYWCGFPFPSPGDLPDLGLEPMSPALPGRFFSIEPPGKPIVIITLYYIQKLREWFLRILILKKMFVFFLFCVNLGWWILTTNIVVTSHDVCKSSLCCTPSAYAVQNDSYISTRLEQQHKKTHTLGKQIFFPDHIMRWERYLTPKYVIMRNVSQSNWWTF